MFATPIRYTVRDKDAIWKFFVTNNGNLTATNVLVTNTIHGLSILTFTPDSGAGAITLSGTLPITDLGTLDGATAVFSVSALSPGEMRAVTVTARVNACMPLHVDIEARLGCLDSSCKVLQKRVDFDKPDPYLLTNNGQTADLPMCDVGQVVFTTKNASSDVSLYQLNITETLRNLTVATGQPITFSIVDQSGALITTTTAFTPEIVLIGITSTGQFTTLLLWKPISAPLGILDVISPLAIVVITVPVRIGCGLGTPQSFAAAQAQGPCGKQLGYTENAVTLQTKQPDMDVIKTAAGPSGGFADRVYANPSDIVTWRVQVLNRNSAHSYVAYNVTITDTWPANFQFITATTLYTPITDTASRTITWTIGIMTPSQSLYLYITGTLTNTVACQTAITNTTGLNYGCEGGCNTGQVPVRAADVSNEPNLQVLLAPGPLSTCGGNLPITIRNYGAPAYSNTLTVTLPYPGYEYERLVGYSLTPTAIFSTPAPPRFSWDVIPGRVNPAPYYEFTLTLRLHNSETSGQCPVEDGRPVTATLNYNFSPTCTPIPQSRTTEVTTTLTVVTAPLMLDKLPRTQTADVGQRITWTVRLTNTDAGLLENLVVTDVVGSNYDPATIVPSNGSDGMTPTIAGNVITWTPNTLPVSGTWVVTLSAVLVASGDNRNVVTATAGCATGCQTALVTDTAYTTLLQQFGKYPAVQTGTIGSLVVFTLTASLPDQNALYQRLALTDTLPVGLGYDSSVLTYTYNSGSPGLISTTPTISPAWLASGPVVWQLGDLSGTIQINGIITAVIQDVPSNNSGLRLTNLLTMTYTDDNQPYIYTSTSPVDILEPLLHIGKSYVTPYGCGATLLQDNFNRPSASPPGGWSTSTGTFSNPLGVAQQTSNNTTDAILYRNANATPNDYSYSAMVWSGDATSSVGMVFRYQNAANHYRLILRLNDGGANINLQEVGGGTPITQTATFTPVPNRWYHLEVQMEGNRIRGYVDGVRYFDVPDSSPRTGVNVGLYANNCAANACRFDDVLVTRLNQSDCLVGANDLVTYTLTISNQNTLPGYDLVITDSLPGGMSLVTCTMQRGAMHIRW